jgi:amidohydrolase
MDVSLDEAKAAICALIDDHAPSLVALSHDIWEHPELAYEEHYAVARICRFFRDAGIHAAPGAYGLDTAFEIRAGHVGPNVVVCCEYDALPDLGGPGPHGAAHACGHNIIGAAGAGAGLALAVLAEELGGRVTILGTPAEEGGGGKIRLLRAGAFQDADVAMMIHPEPGDVAWVPYLASGYLDVVMRGRSAHASSSPWKGVNALDALVLGYTGVMALRATFQPDQKVAGIITNGGNRPNVIPEVASATFQVRARTFARLQQLRERVEACFMGAAAQAGAVCELQWRDGYKDLVSNRPLARAYQANAQGLGRRFVDPRRVPVEVAGSTDMGNVSYEVPSIHPVISMCPLSVAGHSREFVNHARSPAADAAVVDGAKAMAMTGIDVWLSVELLDAVRADFRTQV